MKFNYTKIIQGTVFMVAILLSACGGGGGGAATQTAPPGPAPIQTHQMGGARQGATLNLAPTVSTLAGAAAGEDGIGAGARFQMPSAIVSDGTNLYVADSFNNKIRKVVISTGVVTTLAGSTVGGAADGPGASAAFNEPHGIATDGTNVYVADTYNNKIRKIVIATGVVSSLTGGADTTVTAGAADGAGATATFSSPESITTDGTNLYVADSGNNKIRKIVIATGVVSSFTGVADTASAVGALDGASATATFWRPRGITTDGTNLYVSDTINRKIRKIVIATGVVSSFTGVADTATTYGAVDGASSTASFNIAYSIATDGTNLYVADSGNNKIRLIVIATGMVSSFTGAANTASAPGAADGAGTAATFNYPQGITTVGGKLYVADTNNGTIRTVALSTASVTTLAGNALPGADATGAAASFSRPTGIATDGSNLYVADTYNHKIRKVVIATGVVTTLAGSGGYGAADGAGTVATFLEPHDITTDGTNVYVADTYNNKIRKIVIGTGVVSSLTGVADTRGTTGVADGAGTAATFNLPQGITTDGTNLYVADTGNHKIRRIVIATGEVSSVTGVASTTITSGATDGGSTTATFNGPVGITTDGSNLYVADTLNHKIRKIVLATGEVSSVTGVINTAGAHGATDGSGTAAMFYEPQFITTDGSNLYVSDMRNNKIRKIVLSTGEVSSVTGAANTAGGYGAADGAGATATFSYPQGITTDGANLFVTEQYNQTIRKIQ